MIVNVARLLAAWLDLHRSARSPGLHAIAHQSPANRPVCDTLPARAPLACGSVQTPCVDMKTLTDQLTQYATYHRDRRNIVTHFIGIPMIVASICILLSRPTLSAELPWLTPGAVISVLITLYYLKLDVRYGVVLGAYLWACLAGAQAMAAWTTGAWLGMGVGLFLLGWVIQFVGHYFEGRKPAFVDDLIGLLIGPLFIAAEAGFLLGLRKDVEAEVNARAGAPR